MNHQNSKNISKKPHNENVSNSCKRDNRTTNFYTRNSMQKESIFNELNSLKVNISNSEQPNPRTNEKLIKSRNPRKMGMHKNDNIDFNMYNENNLSMSNNNPNNPSNIKFLK